MWTFGRQIQKAKRPFRTKDTKRLVDLSNQRAGMVSADLYNGLQVFKKRISIQELEQAWETGNWAHAMRVIPWIHLPQDLMPALTGVGSATLAAGKVSIGALPANVNAHLRWDSNNPRLRKYITDRTASLVVGINHETQQVIQNAVVRSLNVAATPREVAKRIKGSIGLFPAQDIALGNYQMKLMSDGVVGPRLEKMVGAYENKLLDYRSTMIARTEMRGATNMGQLSVWREAADQDLIDKNTARRAWIAEGDSPCDDCEEMDGEEVGLDEFWVMPDGTQVETPPWNVHPNCFCSAQLIF